MYVKIVLQQAYAVNDNTLKSYSTQCGSIFLFIHDFYLQTFNTKLVLYFYFFDRVKS